MRIFLIKSKILHVIIKTESKHNYELNTIANMDESPLHLNMTY